MNKNQYLTIINEKLSAFEATYFLYFFIAFPAYALNIKALGHRPLDFSEWLFSLSFVVVAVILTILTSFFISKLAKKYSFKFQHWIRVIMLVLVIPIGAYLYYLVATLFTSQFF